MIHRHLRELEWCLPVAVQRPLLQVFGRSYDPYSSWNHSTRSIFIHVPRTGGTSVAQIIRETKDHRPISRFAAFDAQSYRRYFKFGIVRNPWDRLLSAFSHLGIKANRPPTCTEHIWARKHIKPYSDFEEFVLSLRVPSTRRRILSYIHFRPQLSWIAMPGSTKVELDFVGRFENLSEDFRAIAERLSVNADLPVTNASRHGHYRDFFTPPMRVIAADIYRGDIEALGYDF